MKFSASKIWTSRIYDRIAKYYDTISRRLFPIAEIGQKKVVEDMQSGSILDVGCGTGALLELACAKGLVCYGLDTSAGMLDSARSKAPGGTFVFGSYYAIPYADSSFDYVTETNALGGVKIDIRQALAEMIRVCKTNGEVRIVDGAPPARATWKSRLMTQLGMLIGDEPRDFLGVFRELGFEPQVEVLGGSGIYQLMRVKKTHQG
jgi:ubiquinone/menaquinone biosynthesis C-methylase UbiE